ncbi:RNA polymerase sigma factor, sigma-70 family [Desulfosporosinus orientis DSM 765]|uniref:RNA polymerase sigma factor, sigma-70 family n=1 Tax=Desulfosporosinus orientis (strain ATCC 19365 / DSM 765 / NCIMB 8382 / VKM B-1628 / Singapore I) TaxID=768706 RepID=G7W6R1_DESOD|nr:RNA polymerase sigma factor [Desulfosporosinus orientis]AET69193.1 RNA polymerase sigma factor, sigma-70 family [Desulfosporosinus orientis DSM 765]
MSLAAQTGEAPPLSLHEDDDAFAELYRTYFSRVYNYLHYRVNDVHDADDLTSQVFIKIYTKFKYYCSETAPLSVWVFSIARNTVTDYYRCRGRKAYVYLEEGVELVDSCCSLEEAAAAAEMRRHLRRALALLSQREREIIALKFWSGLSNREIAGFMDISESNTGVILFRAMQRLRQILESQGMNLDD